MKQNKWYNYNQCNPTEVIKNQKQDKQLMMLQELKEAIDQTPGATTEEKEAAKAKVDQAVTEAKGHINEAINNSGVDEAKQMVQLQSMQSNQVIKNQKQDKQSMMLQEPRKKQLIKHRCDNRRKKQLKRK